MKFDVIVKNVSFLPKNAEFVRCKTENPGYYVLKADCSALCVFRMSNMEDVYEYH